jgi:threonine dehydratase
VIQSLIDETVTVTEEEIAEATRWLYTAAKLAAEPAGAATTAALLAGKVRPAANRRVVALVSGGNIDLELLSTILATKSGANRAMQIEIPPDRLRHS